MEVLYSIDIFAMTTRVVRSFPSNRIAQWLALRRCYSPEYWQKELKFAEELRRGYLSDEGQVYFIDGDLTLGNIIVSGTVGAYRIIGIIYLEQAGWCLEYWETCPLLYGVVYTHPWREEGLADKGDAAIPSWVGGCLRLFSLERIRDRFTLKSYSARWPLCPRHFLDLL